MKPSERIAILSGAFFLFALAGLISTGLVWPWVLLLIAVTAFPIIAAEEGWRFALWIGAQLVVWFGGIGLLVMMNWVWPGLLILAGCSAILIALVDPDELKKRHHEPVRSGKEKAKRAIPVPPPLDDDDVLEIMPFNIVDEDDDDDVLADDDALRRLSTRQKGRR